MADICFNIAKGKAAYYGSLPAANDALIAIPIEASGIVSDATMRDYVTLADLLAGACNEQTTMGRKTLVTPVVTVNHTDDRVEIDAVDPTWTAASGSATGALVICYDPDTTASSDAAIVPLAKLDFARTPSGVDITAVFASGGFYQAT